VKRCSKCKVEQDLGYFSQDRNRKDGLSLWCKNCAAESNALRYQVTRESRLISDRAKRNMNRRWVLNYLLVHPCVDCGESDPIVLEFDHVRGDKIRTISNMVSSTTSIAKIEQEIEKCEVRCANCHRKVTMKRAGWFRSTDPSLWENFTGAFQEPTIGRLRTRN
jgi:hypothetical protein